MTASNTQADFPPTMTNDSSTPISDRASRTSERAIRLPLRTKLAYASGAAVESIISNSLNIFLLFYVTAVCGLSGGLAGAALAIGLVVDAVAEPLIGSISDGLQSRLGRRLPLMIIGLPVVVISFVLTFSLPADLSQTQLFLLLVALSTALRISLSVFNLPYIALGAELSDDYVERSKIAVWRWGTGVLGALVALAVGFTVFFKGADGLAQRAAYQPYAMTLTVAIIVLALISMRAVFATRNRQHAAPANKPGWIRSLVAEVIEVLSNRSFRLLFISALLFFTAQGVTSTLGLHANTYFWRLSSAQVQMVTLAFVLGLLLGAPIAGSIVALMEKRTALFASLCGLILAQGSPVTLRLLGWLPLEGQALAMTLAITTAIGGGLMTIAAVAFMSMMADAADEHELLFGARREGLYFAGWSFAGKAATGGGALISGLVLQTIAFPANLASKGVVAAALPASTTNWLGFFYGPGAAVLSLAGVLVVLWYPINRRMHAAIMAELARRRTEPAE
ncbi:MFS transporter [Collimonas fungivorans]|uniref:MFS transporter n=1 Tax=Collimonas fungivorans TaxID=158899 RepID=UPI0026EB7F2B|nr:MFS transporter [Collimonas fungivorans]